MLPTGSACPRKLFIEVVYAETEFLQAIGQNCIGGQHPFIMPLLGWTTKRCLGGLGESADPCRGFRPRESLPG